jgi:ribosomal protein L17
MDLDPGARAGIELTLETAKELRAALDRAITAAEFEEAEVRGKGVAFNLVRAA